MTSCGGAARRRRFGWAVLLRGDTDAPPVTEDLDVDYVSTRAGLMHACGHDLHVAGLIGAAKLLAARRAELAGDVIFMFQPGGGPGGAQIMLDEGLPGGSRGAGRRGIRTSRGSAGEALGTCGMAGRAR